MRGWRTWAVPAVTVSMLLALGPVNAAQRPTASGTSSSVVFTDIARDAGIDFTNINGASPEKFLVETMGSGGLFIDYDNDGWLDVLLVDGGSVADAVVAKRARHRLYRNLHNGRFADVTTASGIRHQQYGMGGCAGDYDNDGWVDVYVTNFGPNVLYRNHHDGTFVDVTRTAAIGAPLWSTSCAFFDMDRDGDLDLFVTNYVDGAADPAGSEGTRPASRSPFCGNAKLKVRTYCHPLNFKPLPNVVYRNNGDGTFTDVTAAAGIAALRGNGLGVVVSDVDDDQWPDVFVANDTMPNFLFFNERGKGLREAGLLAGVAVAIDGTPRAGMGTDAGDYDGDGLFDLIVTNLDLETHSLFHNMGKRLFSYATVEAGLSASTRPFVGFGTAWIDYDNDGAIDLAINNGHVLDKTEVLRAGSKYAQRPQLFRNSDGRRFVETGPTSGAPWQVERVGRGLAAGDIDNDGDLDLLLTTNGGPAVLLRNDGGNAQNAIVVRTIGTTSNRDGIGARLQLMSGGRTQIREIRSGSSYLSQNDMRAHFGLGRATQVERLEVRWPSGRTDVVTSLAANQIVTVKEGEGVTRKEPFGSK